MIGLLALIAFAAAIRLVGLGSFPSNLTADEADNMIVVYKILFGDRPGIFGIDWKPAPAFSMYITAPFVNLFGEGVFGLRFLSALTSVFALVPLYALYRRHVAPPAALLALLLLSTSVWYLNFSRSGWENVHVVALTALAFWLLARALETGAWRYWALSGAVAALGLYSYFAGRAILLSLVAYAPFAFWQRRRELPRVVAGYALLGAVAVALFIPQLPAIKANPEKFNIRAERVSVLKAAREGYFGHAGKGDVLRYQAARNARFFFDGDALAGPSYSPPEQRLQDTRPRYSPAGRPLLDPFTALLFAAGMLLSLLSGTRYALWWAMLLVPWVTTQILTINTPDAARGIGMLPPIYFFVALSLDRAWRALPARPVLRPALVLAVCIAAMLTTVSYFDWQRSPEARLAREPAVPLEEFESWKSVQLARARANQPLLPVTTWLQLGRERPQKYGE